MIANEQQTLTRNDLKPNQVEFLEALRNNTASVGTILGAMRSGKTAPILFYLSDVLSYSMEHKLLWIAVDDKELKSQLKIECAKWGLMHVYEQLFIVLPGSLHKYKDIKWAVIIWNESHKITQRSYDIISKMSYIRLISSLGILSNKIVKQDLFKKIGFDNIIAEYSTAKGVEEKRIADYRIRIVEVPLGLAETVKVNKTKTTPMYYISEHNRYNVYINRIKKIDDKVKQFKESIENNKMSIKDLGPYNAMNKENRNLADHFHDANQRLYTSIKNQYKQKAFESLKLMQFLNACESKFKVAKAFLKKKSDKRYLVFNEFTTHAKKVCDYMYNSKTTDEDFNKFQNFEIPHLGLLNKAGTGETYEKLNGCLFVSINSSNTDIGQKLGRALYNDIDDVKDIVFLISADTIQRDWLDKALCDFDLDKIVTIRK